MFMFGRKFLSDGVEAGSEVSAEMTNAADSSLFEGQSEDDEVRVYTSADQLGNDNPDSDAETEEPNTGSEVDSDSVTDDSADRQSAEENARFAAMRRRAEADAEKRISARQKAIDDQFAAMFAGYKNPVTGQPIRTAADYAEAFAAQQRQQQEQELRSAGIDPSIIARTVQQEVANNPTVKQAEMVLAQQNEEAASRMIDEDVAEIARFDPTVSSIDDLKAQDNFSEIVRFIQNHPGTRMSEAYKLVNFDRLATQKQQAARQQAVNQAKSKAHLNQVSGGGLSGASDGDDIPEANIEEWKKFFPGKNAKELRALYNKTMKNTKRG